MKRDRVKTKGRRVKRVRIHREGLTILLVLLFSLVVYNILIYVTHPQSPLFFVGMGLSILVMGFFLYFFRNPVRMVEILDGDLIVAPADGRVVVIEPTEVDEWFEGQKMLQISIFMSVFSVHANWYPIAGEVKYTKHHSGRHLGAYLPKSSHENEHSSTVIETKSGKQILVRQIAGALARRIVTYAHVGYHCHLNEHLGFIKFGSRVDLFLPLDADVFVTIGEHTRADETIIARLRNKQDTMTNVIIFGAPGSGKGTQSELLIDKYGFEHISTGDVLRSEIKAGTDLGKTATSFIDKGQLIPDDLMVSILASVFDSKKGGKGVIFDGFPRTIPQAEALKKMLAERGTRIAAVVALEVGKEELVTRLVKRGQISGRSDDNLETIQKRLGVYENQTAPLIDFYKKEGLYHGIVGEGSVEEIFGRIAEVVDKL